MMRGDAGKLTLSQNASDMKVPRERQGKGEKAFFNELNPLAMSTRIPAATSLLRRAARKEQSYERGTVEDQKRKEPRHP